MTEPTKIEIGRFIVEWDGSHNWLLSERTTSSVERRNKAGEVLPAGREVVAFVGYYGTLESALQSMLQQHINNSGAQTARGIIAEIQEARRSLRDAASRIPSVNVPARRVIEP